MVEISNHEKYRPILVSGPTACGKSTLGISLAQHLDAEVINIDSVQVYRELDIGSAKVSKEDQGQVKHHLLDIVPPDGHYSVGDYLSDASEKIKELGAKGKRTVLVGGSTMYISSLISGLSALPSKDEELRVELEQLDSETLYDRLMSVDPLSAKKLHPNDRLRTVRAIEVYESSGSTLSEMKKADGENIECPILTVILCWKREILYERINKRSQQLVEDGIVEETRDVIKKYGREITPLKSLGYQQVCEHLRGNLSLHELTEKIAQQTRRYAKRQMTFWRNEPRKRGWVIIPSEQNADVVIGGEPPQNGLKQEFHGFSVKKIDFKQLVEELRSASMSPSDSPQVYYVDAEFLFESLQYS